jgi:hypothetical protein
VIKLAFSSWATTYNAIKDTITEVEATTPTTMREEDFDAFIEKAHQLIDAMESRDRPLLVDDTAAKAWIE